MSRLCRADPRWQRARKRRPAQAAYKPGQAFDLNHALQCPGFAKRRGRVIKIRDGTEVAARHFVYKIYDATHGQPMQWHVLHGMGESAVTISRAVERGWAVLQDGRGKPLDRRASLTDEGRRLARREEK
jgi:hypothetical protein